MSNKKTTKTKPKDTKQPQTDYSYNTVLDTQEQSDVTIPPEVKIKINQISSMFPDMPEDIIYNALQEYNFDVEEVIQRQLDGQLQWTQVKKSKSKNEYKELVKQKTRASRGRKNRGPGQKNSPKERKEKRQQPRKKNEQKQQKQPSVKVAMGEVRNFQVTMNENVQSDHVLSYSEAAAQVVPQPVQEDEEAQQKKLTKKQKKKRKARKKQEQQTTSQQPPQQTSYEQQIDQGQQIVSQKPVTQQTKQIQTKYTPPVVQVQTTSQPKLDTGKVILPSVVPDVPQLQFGTLGIEQQTKQTTQFGTSMLRTQPQQPTKQELTENITKQSTQNVQTETENTGTTWENQFNQHLQHQQAFYNYQQQINDNRKKDQSSTQTDDKTQQPYTQQKFVPSQHHQFIPSQYGQYYGYPYMIPPNQFQYQGYPHPNSKFPQAPFYNKGVYGYGTNYPVTNSTGMPYEEMDYTKMGQQMYYIPQHQRQQPQTQESSTKTKPQSPNVYMQQEETFEQQQQHAPYFGEMYHAPYNYPYMYQPNPYQNPTLSQQKMHNPRQPDPKQQTTTQQSSQQQKQGPGNWDSQVYGH